jgi:hypothetical protein
MEFRVLKAKYPGPSFTGRGVVFYKGECIPLSTFLSREIFNFFYFFLNSFLFRSIVPQFPGSLPLLRGLAQSQVRGTSRKVKEVLCRIISVKSATRQKPGRAW